MLKICLLFILFFSISACSTQKKIQPETASHRIKDSAKTVVINLKALQTISSITPDLAKHKVVFVGESHTNYTDHLNQLAVIESLQKHWGNNLSIGLEMIQQPYQSYLDDYVAGKTSELEMLKGTQWYDRWVYDFRLYRPIFDYAKQNKIPLIALNIPKELTKKITKVGIKGLNKTERQQLPKFIDRTNVQYAKRIKNVFNGHMRTSSKGFDKFFDAQLAWDEGMAFNATKYLKNHPKKHMVILAGKGHVIKREGIPNRVDRQNKSTSTVVLNNVSNTLSATQGDYLLESKEIKLPPAGLMGIFLGDSDGGVIVKGLSRHGAAKKAGLVEGDMIITLNKTMIKTSTDVKLWGLDKIPKDTVMITVERKGKEHNYSFLLKSPTKKSMYGLKPHK